jgi:hypothetical protein
MVEVVVEEQLAIQYIQMDYILLKLILMVAFSLPTEAG